MVALWHPDPVQSSAGSCARVLALGSQAPLPPWQLAHTEKLLPAPQLESCDAVGGIE